MMPAVISKGTGKIIAAIVQFKNEFPPGTVKIINNVFYWMFNFLNRREHYIN